MSKQRYPRVKSARAKSIGLSDGHDRSFPYEAPPRGWFYGPVYMLSEAARSVRTQFARILFSVSGPLSIYDVLERQRAALLESEASAVRELLRAYAHAERGIQAELNKVLAKLLKAQDAGTDVNQVWLFQHGRLKELIAQVQLEASRFGGAALKVTTAQQVLNVIQALNDTGALMKASGVRSGFVMLHKEAFSDLVGFLSDGSPLHEIFAQISEKAVADARQAFAQSMAIGRNPRVTGRIIRKAVDDALQMSRNRAVLIARTETMRAYRTATLRNYANNPAIVQGWRWLSGRDGRCCPVCAAMDGTAHSLDEPFASHPGCRCSAVPILSEELDTNIGTGEEWLDAQDDATQLSVMGSPTRLEMWKSGEVTLQDMVEETESAKWGPGRKLKPLKDLKR